MYTESRRIVKLLLERKRPPGATPGTCSQILRSTYLHRKDRALSSVVVAVDLVGCNGSDRDFC